MEHIGERVILHYLPYTDIRIPMGGLNIITVLSTLLVMVLLWGVLRLAVSKFAWVPGRGQLMVELFVTGFDSMVISTLNLKTREANRHYLPLISCLFLFIVLCNGLPLLPIPHVEEPTSDLNCTLALGMTSVLYSVYCGFRAHGVLGHLGEMCGPFWHHEGKLNVGAALGKVIGLGFFFPLHIIETLSRMLSISCRLFGNITGAAIVLTVLSTLSFGLVLPLGLNAFFLFFESAVQAFVFSMLTLIYIATSIQHE
jgi:F-type H+-transporting ATPase subunit a